MGVFIVFVGSFLFAFCISGLCSVAESVLLSLSTAQVVEIEQKNKKIGEIWSAFKRDLNPPITSILALNTAAHTIGASVAGAAFAKIFGTGWIWAFSLAFTFLMLQYTEILPKTLGVRHAERLAFWIARPLWFATKVGAPINAAIRFFNKPFESKKGKENVDDATPLKEIALLTSLARNRKQLDEEQLKVIVAALKLAKKTVGVVASPFDEVATLSDIMPASEALKVAQIAGYTRFPVCRGVDRENVVGYVNVKELIPSAEYSPTLESAKRDIREIQANESVSNALALFVREHEHVALVVDPTTKRKVGLVTLEDLIEELLGEIEDEFDKMPKMLYEKEINGKNFLVVGGGRLLTDVRASVKRLFPKESDAFVEETAEFPETTTFAQWFVKKSSGTVVRNLRVYCDELEFLVRRTRFGQVFDAQIRQT